MTSDGTRRRDARRPDRGPEVPEGPWGLLHAVVAFALEVAALGAYWYIGTRLAPGAAGIFVGILAAAALAAVWALFMAPRARRRIQWPRRPLAALALFVAAGAGLMAYGSWWGAAMIVLAAADTALAFWLRRKHQPKGRAVQP